MIRDKDLRKWGRLAAAIMILLGMFLIGAAVFSSYHVQGRLKPSMQSFRRIEQEQVQRIADERLRQDFMESSALNRKIDESWFAVVRAIILGGGIGGSLLAFYAAALSWRCYELASISQTTQASNDQAEQDVTPNA